MHKKALDAAHQPDYVFYLVLAENAHPFENPSLRIDNPFGLFGLTGRLPSG